MNKELDNDLREALEETLPMVKEVFEVLLKHSNDEDKEKIRALDKAFEDLGVQYNVCFKVGAIKKTIDDLDMMLTDSLQIKV